IQASDVPPDVVQRLRAFTDKELAAAVSKAFGSPKPISSEETAAEIGRLKKLLSSRAGDADSGAAIFQKRCASCHRLFGEGESIAPALDPYDRKNLNFWLPAILAPSLEIREGYQSYLALTEDDRIITGMIAAQDVSNVTLRTSENRLITLPREEIVELKAIATSLMPADLLKELNEKQLRDLFAYLMQD
ncbi:MAG: c-type cytochrome, partial [Planctomycetota bacterium]